MTSRKAQLISDSMPNFVSCATEAGSIQMWFADEQPRLVVRGDVASGYHADIKDKLQQEAQHICKGAKVQVSFSLIHF